MHGPRGDAHVHGSSRMLQPGITPPLRCPLSAVRCPLYAVNLADTREYVLLTYVFPKAKLSLSLDSKAWRGGATLIGHDLYKALEWRRQFPLVSSYSDSGLGPEMVIG